MLVLGWVTAWEYMVLQALFDHRIFLQTPNLIIFCKNVIGLGKEGGLQICCLVWCPPMVCGLWSQLPLLQSILNVHDVKM